MLMMNPIKILRSLAFNATSESKPHIQIPIMPPPSPSSDLKHKKSVSICRNRDFIPVHMVHISYVPDEEIGGSDGAAKFVQSKEFKELNVGFMMDEGQALPRDEFRVFYADRSPWSLIIKAKGTLGHGLECTITAPMENLMKSVEIIGRFRESQFEIVKAGEAANSEVISVNPVFVNAGIPCPK
ncbi:aminoacylase-1-like [Cucumis melo var. makuwa]|uniref:Aminoacylase-1-like n=1 Tax=Cucumis melo var. makuwa TaxID=1194695 RepID=A0A5D3CQ42_CUCMM|nr:aminoacylase-1-like [Cucumis melo var. makuwa]TYK13911.1 aminoacylase-1-like [Cucumis melo var. makuwa]